MITSICPKSIDPNFHLKRQKENFWVDIERDLNDFNRDYCSDIELAERLMEHIQIALANRQAPFCETENYYKNIQLSIDVLDAVEKVLMLNMKQDNVKKREVTLGEVIERLQKIKVL